MATSLSGQAFSETPWPSHTHQPEPREAAATTARGDGHRVLSPRSHTPPAPWQPALLACGSPLLGELRAPSSLQPALTRWTEARPLLLPSPSAPPPTAPPRSGGSDPLTDTGLIGGLSSRQGLGPDPGSQCTASSQAVQPLEGPVRIPVAAPTSSKRSATSQLPPFPNLLLPHLS